MFWIDLARIVLPGVILGFILGKVVAENLDYIRILNPRTWIVSAKRASRRRWIRFLSLSVIFAGLAFFIIGYIEVAVAAIWPIASKEEYIFYKVAEVSVHLLFISVVFLPVLEEWIFRGIILEEIAQRSRSPFTGLVGSSLIFAAFHLSNPGIYPAAVIHFAAGGLILGGCYILEGLAASVLAHSLYNVLLILPLILVGWP